jgi:hypothetical protein
LPETDEILIGHVVRSVPLTIVSASMLDTLVHCLSVVFLPRAVMVSWDFPRIASLIRHDHRQELSTLVSTGDLHK